MQNCISGNTTKHNKITSKASHLTLSGHMGAEQLANSMWPTVSVPNSHLEASSDGWMTCDGSCGMRAVLENGTILRRGCSAVAYGIKNPAVNFRL